MGDMWLTRITTSLMLLLLTAAPVLAQAMPQARERSFWKGVTAALVLTACVGVVSMISAKRSHQD
jgi:NADH:ubiquinone oxidoreductase subunit 2 (subunit N)